MRRENRTLLLFVTILLVVVLLYGCNLPLGDSGGDQQRPPQTKILKVLVQPDTVAPGDTASFTCVIKDSTDARFKFLWFVSRGNVIGINYSNTYGGYVSDSNMIKWEAPSQSGSYAFDVYAFNGAKDSASVDQSFTITVK